MKKRILCTVMSAVMIIGLMTGCGSEKSSSGKTERNIGKEADENNKTEKSKETDSKKEEKYAERMEAYLDYFQSEEKDYDGVVAAAITLDSDSLPLLWLAYADSEDRGSDMRFQLCVYENDKVDVMAEKKIEDVDEVYPYLNDGISALQLGFDDGDGDDPAALIYDSEEQDFRFYDENNFKYEGYNNADEYCEKMQSQDIMDAYRIMDRQRQFLTLNYGDETAYFGIMDLNDIYFSILDNIGALDYPAFREGDNMCGRILKNEFKDDKIVSKIFEEHFKKQEGKDYYLTYPDSYLPDGTLATDDEEAMCKYFDITKEDVTNSGLALRKTDCMVEFLSNMDAKALMRNLIKHPAYTSFDILLANAKLYEDSNDAANLKFGDIVEVKELLKDAADNKDNSADSTESIRREDSTESIKREDSTESIHQEDSTEVSGKSIENMSGWKQAYINYINSTNETVDSFQIIDIHEDGVPEIFYRYNTDKMAKLLYINKSGKVNVIDAMNDEGDLVYNSHNIADSIIDTERYKEIIYKYDENSEDYDLVFSGEYTINTSANEERKYYIDDKQVDGDEYTRQEGTAGGNVDSFEGFECSTGDIISAIEHY